jgi:ADP-heptose:LPS heptosyltransferase
MTGLVQVAVPRHLGDAIVSLGALRQLADGLPARPLRLVCPSALVLDLLADQGPWQRGSRAFLPARDGVAVLFAPSLRVALAAWRARIPRRIGLPSDHRGLLLSDLVGEPGAPLPSRGLPALLPAEHQSQQYLRIAQRALGVMGGTTTPTDSHFSPGPEHRSRGLAWWQQAGAPNYLLHPWAQGLSTKRWALERWVQVGEELQGRGERVAVSGGPAGKDADLAAELAAQLQVPVCAGSSCLPPATWVVVASLCSSVLLCDTGLAHLCAAAGLAPVVLFGPTDPQRHAPLQGQLLWGGRELSCSPCYSETCSNATAHLCMDSVRVPDVLALLRDGERSEAGRATEGRPR